MKQMVENLAGLWSAGWTVLLSSVVGLLLVSIAAYLRQDDFRSVSA
ncbi:MAG TPA: hypothetical protein VJK02_10005 [Anaerolineales bacterium]|nr:hypothetical protein [Anaerolineales bacterium]